jgi:hypothetical protein
MPQRFDVAYWHLATTRQVAIAVAFGGIVLQKSQVAAPRFSGENKKREAIADSFTLIALPKSPVSLT